MISKGSPCGSDGKESVCSLRDLRLIPGSGRSSGEGNCYPLQCACLENLENLIDRRASWATVLEVAEGDRTKQLTLSLFLFFFKVGDFHNIIEASKGGASRGLEEPMEVS